MTRKEEEFYSYSTLSKCPGREVKKFLQARIRCWLHSVRDSFVSLLPLTLLGTTAILLLNLPYPPYQSLLRDWSGSAWQDYLNQFVSASHGVFGMALSAVVAYHVTARLPPLKRADLSPPPLAAAMSSLVNFMICAQHVPQWQQQLGYHAMLLAICVGIASAELLRWAAGRSWLTIVKVPSDADRVLHHALRLSTPIILSGIFTLVIAGVLLRLLPLPESPFTLRSEWFIELPFSDYVMTSVATLMNQGFWLIGLHGGHLLDAYASDLFSLSTLPPDGKLAWRPLFDMFVLIGGTGATLGLVIAILIAVPNGSQRRIAQLGLLPSLFNINEVIVFGLPIVFSPVYWIPFLLVPLTLTFLSLTALHFGWVEMHPVNIHWSTPQLISGWLVTNSWRGALLQAVEIAISTALYLPFVRRAEADRRKRQGKIFRHVIKAIPAEVTERDTVIRRDDEAGLLARSLLKELRADIKEGNLFLNYQPKHHRDGHLVGVEALVRWDSREFGPVPTLATVTLAEDGGCIRELGAWVVAEVCACKARWNALGYKDVSIALNVSPTQLMETEFAPGLASALRYYEIDNSEVEIEITESLVIPDEAATNATLEALSALGIRLSVDDFGMGYTSLLHLRRFDIHAIKLDGSLTRDVLVNRANADIIKAITALARARNVVVIAEFIETCEQREALSKLGCNVFQGHFHSPALSEADCLRYIASQ